MKKFKILTIILLSLNLIAVTVSIVLSSIAIHRQEFSEIYNCHEVGFDEIFGIEPIEKMYIYNQGYSFTHSEFYEEEVADELYNLIKTAVFQKVDYGIDLYEDNPYTRFLLSLYTENNYLQIGFCNNDCIYIITKDSYGLYKTNVAKEIKSLATRVANKYIQFSR